MTTRNKEEFDNIETTDVLEKSASLGLSHEQLMDIYRTMVKIRLFEEMADKQYALGKVHGTMHLSAGQEAVAVGVGFAIQKRDYLLNHHRGHGHFIASGADVNKMMAEFLGKDTGYCHGRGGSMHIADVTANNLGANGIVGGGLQLAVGVGLAVQMKKTDQVVLTIFGDGAANEGIFHESLNMAGALGAFQGHYATNVPLLCAGTILILVPTLIIFILFQRQIITALIQGAVKG